MSVTLDDVGYMLENMEFGPTGDLVRQNGTLQVYWSNIQWEHPPSALLDYPEDWVNLGTESWWGNPQQKAIFNQMKLWAGDLWPVYPNEWCRLDDVGWDWQI